MASELLIKLAKKTIQLEECPVVDINSCTTESILEIIEAGKLGFCLVTEGQRSLVGIVSSADIRKALLNQLKNKEPITTNTMVNEHPLTIQASDSVFDLLKMLKRTSFPVMYLPVVNDQGQAVGIINFVNLIKGEL